MYAIRSYYAHMADESDRAAGPFPFHFRQKVDHPSLDVLQGLPAGRGAGCIRLPFKEQLRIRTSALNHFIPPKAFPPPERPFNQVV